MHACGHDIHMTAWVGTARLLAARKDRWKGTLVMIAQPAEEIGEGAKAMLDDGLYTRFPKPDYALALHDAAQLPAGQIGYHRRLALANVDSVDIIVKGVGGHGAYPHTDQGPDRRRRAIVMRAADAGQPRDRPARPGVVTVGSFHGGTKHNIIPDEAKLQLTVRSYSDAQRKLLLDGIRRIARARGDGRRPARRAGCRRVTVEDPYTPATFNDRRFHRRGDGRLPRAVRRRRGSSRCQPVMAGEDFSQYRRADPEHIKSLIFWVGGERPRRIAAAKAEGERCPRCTARSGRPTRRR